MTRSLDQNAIILAGATGGLGNLIGQRLADAGADLVLVGRDEARLQSCGLPGSYVVGDIADAAACAHAVSSAIQLHGRLDGVVNAAGVVGFGGIDELTDSQVDQLLATNLVGPIRLVRAALPHMADGGFIANISAVVAETPMPNMAVYSATKAALSALDAALAKELRRRKIDVIDARPPHTETGLADRPVAGTAPTLPEGLAPDAVAARIVAAIVAGERDVPSDQF